MTEVSSGIPVTTGVYKSFQVHVGHSTEKEDNGVGWAEVKPEYNTACAL